MKTYIDAYYGGLLRNLRCTFDNFTLLCGNVAWRSKNQDLVAGSNIEAKFRAMRNLWLIMDENCVTYLEIKCEGPI
jgi:hypothetical protein